MKIDDLTMKQIKDLSKLFSVTEVQSTPEETKKASLLKIGLDYLIRTVTMMYTGTVLDITDTEILLGGAAWIADSGRYADALEKGTLNEVEPYPDTVIISRSAIVDAARWKHPLPREQK